MCVRMLLLLLRKHKMNELCSGLWCWGSGAKFEDLTSKVQHAVEPVQELARLAFAQRPK